MYLINKESNTITQIDQKTFSDLNFRERDHLQEWLANYPDAFGEDLLIIQKEFNGFNDTNERLDLLALDRHGNLIIIENKLDDTGRDVTWQVLKYASYCSTLTKEQIRKIYQEYLSKQGKEESAEQNLVDFYQVEDFAELSINNGLSQRIILVAGNFRKEVTSTVLWLMNYKLRIQCFKVTPFQLGEQLLLNVEQIIPMKDAEDFIISMAEKTQDNIDSQEELKERNQLRIEFWKGFLKVAEPKIIAFQNVNSTDENWISTKTVIPGVLFCVCITRTNVRTEIYIARQKKEENKFIFDELRKQEENLKVRFGNNLIWDRLDEKKASRVKFSMDANYSNKENWQKMFNFMIESFIDLEQCFKSELVSINQKLRKLDN